MWLKHIFIILRLYLWSNTEMLMFLCPAFSCVDEDQKVDSHEEDVSFGIDFKVLLKVFKSLNGFNDLLLSSGQMQPPTLKESFQQFNDCSDVFWQKIKRKFKRKNWSSQLKHDNLQTFILKSWELFYFIIFPQKLQFF